MENNMTRLVCLFIDFIISPASMKQNVMVLKYNYVDDFLTSSIKWKIKCDCNIAINGCVAIPVVT